MQKFIDRLLTKERVSKISSELHTLEKLLWSHIADDVPDLYRQNMHLIQSNEPDQRSTHFDMIEDTLEQAGRLKEMFGEFLSRRMEMKQQTTSLNLAEGVQFDFNDNSDIVVGGRSII